MRIRISGGGDARAGRRDRDAEQRPEARAAIDPRGALERDRDVREEVAQQPGDRAGSRTRRSRCTSDAIVSFRPRIWKIRSTGIAITIAGTIWRKIRPARIARLPGHPEPRERVRRRRADHDREDAPSGAPSRGSRRTSPASSGIDEARVAVEPRLERQLRRHALEGVLGLDARDRRSRRSARGRSTSSATTPTPNRTPADPVREPEAPPPRILLPVRALRDAREGCRRALEPSCARPRPPRARPPRRPSRPRAAAGAAGTAAAAMLHRTMMTNRSTVTAEA